MKIKEKMRVAVVDKPSQTGIVRYFISKDSDLVAVLLWDNDHYFDIPDEIAADKLIPIKTDN